MVLSFWKKSSPILPSALFLLCFPICNHVTLLTHIVHSRIVHSRLFDTDPLSLTGRELKLIHRKKQRNNDNLRNCFFSPVQCLLPFDNGHSMASNSKKRIEFLD